MKNFVETDSTGNISDGYHTFNELYRYRMLYNSLAFNIMSKEGRIRVEKSKRYYSNGELCLGDGYFIVIAYLPTGQISNHYELKHWDLFNIPEVEAPTYPFDNHTPNDVADRIEEYLLRGNKD